MGANVLNGLFDATGNDQLWVNGKLGITDRIEQVGKARDQRWGPIYFQQSILDFSS
jgi:hypothetical protein